MQRQSILKYEIDKIQLRIKCTHQLFWGIRTNTSSWPPVLPSTDEVHIKISDLCEVQLVGWLHTNDTLACYLDAPLLPLEWEDTLLSPNMADVELYNCSSINNLGWVNMVQYLCIVQRYKYIFKEQGKNGSGFC